MEAIAEGLEDWWVELASIAFHRGDPVSPELIAQLKWEEGNFCLEYHIAREAGAAGDLDKAFSSLERALAEWTNPPFAMINTAERDSRWGNLRDHPEFKRLIAEKRRRIGPIYGSLWHVPGWVGIPVDVRKEPT